MNSYVKRLKTSTWFVSYRLVWRTDCQNHALDFFESGHSTVTASSTRHRAKLETLNVDADNVKAEFCFRKSLLQGTHHVHKETVSDTCLPGTSLRVLGHRLAGQLSCPLYARLHSLAYLEAQVYANKPRTHGVLNEHIRVEIRATAKTLLQRVKINFRSRFKAKVR